MSATKGPIERIRDACNHAEACGVNPPVGESIEDILIACDELSAQQHACVERYPYVWMLTTEEADAVLAAISEALNIIGRDKTDGAALEKIAKEWRSLHDKPDRQTLLATVSMAEWDCIFRALESMGMLEADGFDEMGRRIAKICAEWIDGKQTSTPQPEPIDNGDGTVTFTGVPVIVPAAIVEDGSTVLAVRPPKPNDRYGVMELGEMRRIATLGADVFPHSAIRVIFTAPPAPQFRAGGYYRTRGGEVVGPIRRVAATESECVLIDDRTGANYTDRGCRIGSSRTDGDLLPGDVTVWQPPASLKAGEYVWTGHWLRKYGIDVLGHLACKCFHDWTNPPKKGRYRVPGGGKPATWEGEA